MAFREYVAEEIATDAADGLIPRREALRRLGLLGLSLPAAAALLAACGGDDDDDSEGATADTDGEGAGDATTTSATAAAPAQPLGTPGAAITYPGPAGTLMGSWSAAADPIGSLLIIHENKGLSPHFKALPSRFAAKGFNSLAVDLLSGVGGTDKFADPAEATAALTARPAPDLVADLRASLDELERRGAGLKLGAMGFCFGGAMTWSLLAAKEARLAAAIPCYGTPPDPADFTGGKAAVLAVYGELDARVNATRDAATAALVAAKVTHEIKTYPGVDHAFFNETGQRYNADAANAAFLAATEWLGRYLA